MKKLISVFAIGLAMSAQSRMALAQDALPNNILWGPLMGIEELAGFGLVTAVFRGGQTIVTYTFASACSPDSIPCTSLMKSGQTARLVAVSDSGARTVLDRRAIQVDADNPVPYVTQRVTIQSNIIDQLTGGAVVLELETDGTVLGASPMLRVGALSGPLGMWSPRPGVSPFK